MLRVSILILLLSSFSSFASWQESAAETISRSGLSVPLYGNYCGLNYGDLKYQVEPIDGIDRACMLHDQCYDANYNGLQQSCACDVMTMEKLHSAVEQGDFLSPKAVIIGSVISLWLSRSPCQCRQAEGDYLFLAKPRLKDKLQCQFEENSPFLD